jgi:hypothetical protein
MTAIKFTSVTDKLLVDGTRRVTLDIEPCDSLAYVTLFGRPGTLGAMSALNLGVESMQNETIAAAKEPAGQLCREAYGYCKEPMFWEWLEQGYGDGGELVINSEQDAKAAMLIICDLAGESQIKSRRNFDESEQNRSVFMELIRNPYREWVKQNETRK